MASFTKALSEYIPRVVLDLRSSENPCSDILAWESPPLLKPVKPGPFRKPVEKSSESCTCASCNPPESRSLLENPDSWLEPLQVEEPVSELAHDLSLVVNDLSTEVNDVSLEVRDLSLADLRPFLYPV